MGRSAAKSRDATLQPPRVPAKWEGENVQVWDVKKGSSSCVGEVNNNNTTAELNWHDPRTGTDQLFFFFSFRYWPGRARCEEMVVTRER